MKNNYGVTVRIPRKLKKEVKEFMGESELPTQRMLIRAGLLDNFVTWKSDSRCNEQSFDIDFSTPKSGLICNVCGYDDSLKCFIEDRDEPDAEILCGEHAALEGYCCCCGQFSAGITSFDFHHPGYCDNCYDQVVADSGEDDDRDEY